MTDFLLEARALFPYTQSMRRDFHVHPELGFQSGIKKAGYSAQFTLIIKFLNTPNQYLAKRVHSNDSIVPTNQFVGPYIGMDFGKSIIEFNKSELQFLIGIGFDAFTALDPLSDAYSRYEDVRSYNLNFGLRYNYFFLILLLILLVRISHAIASPCSAPQRMKVNLASCQKPHTIKVMNTASISPKTPQFLNFKERGEKR